MANYLLDSLGERVYVGERLEYYPVIFGGIWVATVVHSSDGWVVLHWDKESNTTCKVTRPMRSGYQLRQSKKIDCVHQRFRFE